MASEYKVTKVTIWGHMVGALAWNPSRNLGEFEFDPAFTKLGMDLAPLHMPIGRSREIFSFPDLNRATYFGLPGMLADALPDRWGNQLIDRWLALHGRSREDFSPAERLCYMGRRAMGALEFEPVLHGTNNRSAKVEIEHLVELARDILKQRDSMSLNMNDEKTEAVKENVIKAGIHVNGFRWYGEVKKGVVGWSGATPKDKGAILYCWALENPCPDKVISSI